MKNPRITGGLQLRLHKPLVSVKIAATRFPYPSTLRIQVRVVLLQGAQVAF